MHYTVRPATIMDAEGLFALNEALNDKGCTTMEALQHSFIETHNEIIYVAEASGTLIGFCCAQVYHSMCYATPCGEITELFVDENHRRQGVARALLNAVETALTARGVHAWHLLTGGRNLSAQALYRSIGYAPSGQAHFEKSISEPE